MREIRFRAWDKANDKMLYSSEKFHGHPIWYLETVECKDEFEVMQFTGMQDHNGNDIYEGDIVLTAHNLKGVIEYSGTCFIINCLEGCIFDWFEEEVEIIGNIYEHPDWRIK